MPGPAFGLLEREAASRPVQVARQAVLDAERTLIEGDDHAVGFDGFVRRPNDQVFDPWPGERLPHRRRVQAGAAGHGRA